LAELGLPMAGVRCIRKPAAPGKPRPAPPLATGATGAERLPEAMRRTCRKRHNALPPPAPHQSAAAPLLEKNTSPTLLCHLRPNEKKESRSSPEKRPSEIRCVARSQNCRAPHPQQQKTGAQRGLKCFQRENLQKNKEKYRAKNTQRPESSPTGVFRPTLPHD